MTIEQAIYEIVNASYQERVQAISAIADSLKQITPKPIDEPNEPFSITPFSIGSGNLLSRAEIYIENK